MLTAYVDGREMTAREISDWLYETRGYRVAQQTIGKRIKGGLTGEVLLSKPRQTKPTGQHKKWPQKLVRVNVPGWGCRT